MVVGVVAIMGFLLYSNLVSAQNSPEALPQKPPAVVSCTQDTGTTVVFKANEDIENLSIGTYCSHSEVPSGWSVVCRVGKPVDYVDVSYTVKGHERRTKVACS